jgi:hypothetical protein
LIPQVDIEVAAVRAEGGKVCQVTPVADTYAREAMRRLRGGPADRNFVPGFTGILCGEGGLVKEPVEPTKQARAMFERTQQLGLELIDQGAITGAAADATAIANSKFLEGFVRVMQTLAQPTVLLQRLAEVSQRIEQLEYISANPALLESLDRKFALYRKEHTDEECEGAAMDAKFCNNTAEKLVELRAEVESLNEEIGADATSALPVLGQVEYEELLRGTGESLHLDTLLEQVPDASDYVQDGLMSTAAFAKMLGRAGYITCPQTDLLPNAMNIARKAIEDLEEKEMLGLCETNLLKTDLTVLYACYNKAAIPDLNLNFLRNYRENKDYWPAVYTDHTRPALIPMPRPDAAAVQKSQAHKEVGARVGSTMLKDMAALQKEIYALEDRLHSQEACSDLFDEEEAAEPFAFKRRLAPSTVERLTNRVPELQDKLDAMKESTGISENFQYAIDDLIREAIR